jgi:hypothetical protein
VKQSLDQNLTPWYAPATIGGWRRRLLSARTLTLVLGLTLLISTELRFDWIERALGSYLVTTNPYRPKSGVGWRQGLEADKARQTLAEFSSQRQNSQIEAQRATSLGQVIDSVDGEKGAMISAEHFVELYLKLPPAISHEIVSPYVLLAKLSEGLWQRVFLDRQTEPLRLALLDANNQVIQRFSIGAELLGYIEQGEVAVRAGLDTMSDFAEHIYPADKFFSVLSTLSDGMRGRILSHPEDLLRVTGRVRRVGISDTPQGGTVDLGFEVDDANGPKVILMQGRFEDVWRLQSALEGRYPTQVPLSQEDVP